MLTLAFETSCDETSVAVLSSSDNATAGPNIEVLSNVVASQIDIHKRFGGVVPEVASRNHLLAIETVTAEALKLADVSIDQITQIAATTHPGLVGAVMVGRVFAESMATAKGLPFVGVNHIIGHISSCVLSNPTLKPPFMALVVSGGHTAIYRVQNFISTKKSSYVRVLDTSTIKLIASTTDDACGEAFDKVAKVLGLPYPGGPQISKMASSFKGDTDLVFMPNANYKKTTNFSYSGLKTAVLNYVNKKHQKGETLNIPEISFAFEREAIGQLTAKCKLAGGKLPLAVSGGVAANKHLREQFPNAFFPEPSLCGDNAAMVGAAAILFGAMPSSVR